MLIGKTKNKTKNSIKIKRVKRNFHHKKYQAEKYF